MACATARSCTSSSSTTPADRKSPLHRETRPADSSREADRGGLDVDAVRREPHPPLITMPGSPGHRT